MKPEKNSSTQEGDSLIRITTKGDFNNTFRFLNKMSKFQINKILEKYGQMGVEALRSATPIDSGKTAESWGYEISVGKEGATIHWTNTNQRIKVSISQSFYNMVMELVPVDMFKELIILIRLFVQYLIK